MPDRHALIVGIDRYSKFEEQYQLAGCVNDARLIKSILVDHFGFSDSNITELHDAAASQQGILQAMDQLAERIAQDDIVVFHFSGHGARRTSSNPDEGSGLDSTIVPADSGRVDPFPNLDIVDDEIGEWIERLARRTANITLIFDCCHSGTITRDVSGARVRGVPADRRSLTAMGVAPEARPTRRGVAGSGQDRYRSCVVMSGCRDDEYSHEYSFDQGGESVRSGALTHFLTRALLRARPGTTYRDVFEQARQDVNTHFPQQHPQIEGTQDREIFGTRDLEPLRFLPLTAIDGDTATLGGGAAHGLLVGSVWTAYPPGTKKSRDAAPLATIEIVKVGALTATGRVLDGAAALTVGARCVETAQSARQFILRIDLGTLEETLAAPLRARLSESRLLEPADNAETADLRMQHLAPGQAAPVDTADPTPVASARWAVIDRSGILAMPLRAVEDEGAIDALVDNLESIARFRNALALDNPGSALAVDFNIYRVAADETLEPANGGDFEFREGDRLAFEIVNREQRNVFVSVLDFGLTGRISLVYPQSRAGEMIAPGKTLRIGLGAHRMTLGIPKGFEGKLGTETLKAFISTEETDFRWLQQGALRSLGAASAGLRRQFELACLGPNTRELTVEIVEDPDQDWIAPTRSFILKRATH